MLTSAATDAGVNGTTAVVAWFRLPISGLPIRLLQLTGAEDLLLSEAASGGAGLALALAQRLARTTDNKPVDWSGLAVSDLDALMLRLRQAFVGDRIRAEVFCQAPACGQRIDLSFSVDDYLAHHVPRVPRGRVGGWSVSSSDQSGWFCLVAPVSAVLRRSSSHRAPGPAPLMADEAFDQTRALFRVPTVADQLAVEGLPDAADQLAKRCIKTANLSSRLRRRIEAAMEVLAPSLSGDLQGMCPECGTAVTAYLDARQFSLQELRNRAAFVCEDIDILAQRYHWSEREILALPHTRRASYAQLARQHR
jgi:hypothetical protein